MVKLSELKIIHLIDGEPEPGSRLLSGAVSRTADKIFLLRIESFTRLFGLSANTVDPCMGLHFANLLDSNSNTRH